MTPAEREAFLDDFARIFVRAALRQWLREVEGEQRREQERQPRDSVNSGREARADAEQAR